MDGGIARGPGSWPRGMAHPPRERAQGAKLGCWERGVFLAEPPGVEMTPDLDQLQREASGREVVLRGLRKSFSPCLRAAVVNGSFEF